MDFKEMKEKYFGKDINYIKEALYSDELLIQHYSKEEKDIFEIKKSNDICCKIAL